MFRLPPSSTRTATLVPYTTRFRPLPPDATDLRPLPRYHRLGHREADEARPRDLRPRDRTIRHRPRRGAVRRRCGRACRGCRIGGYRGTPVRRCGDAGKRVGCARLSDLTAAGRVANWLFSERPAGFEALIGG